MATQTRTTATNAAEMLRTDHQKVKRLFREYFELGERAYKSKERLAEEIFHELDVHTRLEEEIFYPAARELHSAELEEVVEEGYEEHHVVDLIIGELRNMTPEDGQYDAKMTVLCENVQHHIEEEEKEMLPEAERKLGGRIETLGEEMQRRRELLMAGK